MDGAHLLSVSTGPALHLRNEKETFVISMKTFNGAFSFLIPEKLNRILMFRIPLPSPPRAKGKETRYNAPT